MRMAITVFCLWGALAGADDLLVRIRLGPSQTPADVAQAGADVLFLLGDGCIARVGTATPASLARGFIVEQLDQLRPSDFDLRPSARCYVYVSSDRGIDQDALAGWGDVLARDQSGVLLRTTEDGITSLNQLPVELCRIPMRPMVFSQLRQPEPCVVDDSLVWTLVSRVSQDTLEAFLRRLIAFFTRYSTTDSCRSAANWVRARLEEYNCDSTALHTFRANYAPNVIGVKRGTVNPNRIYVVSGHIDNTSELAPSGYAPGSDDNASGMGTVLEVARVCADIEFENTVWFLGFSGEEQGLVGSDSFVYACRQRGDSIALAINFDMVSYGRDDSITVVWTSNLPETRNMALYFLALADTFTELKAKDTMLNTANSDHASFWRYGYLAIRGRYHDRTPKYHTTGDTIGPFHYVDCGTNNLPMYTEVVKATVATIAKLAGAHQLVGAGERAMPSAARLWPGVGPTVSRSRLGITAPSGTQVQVYDASGQLVRQSSGRLGPGLYFVRRAGTSPEGTAKLVLVD